MSEKKSRFDNILPFIKEQSSPKRIIVIVGVLIILFICLINVYSSNAAYKGYDIIQSTTRDDGESAGYMEYADGYIRYSNDGIAYYRNRGNAVWNYTYEISNAQVKICGEYIVVGNISGRNLFIFNKNGKCSEIDAAMTITQVAVAQQGVTAVTLEDGNTNYINIYDANGNKLIYIKTVLNEDGYPLEMALSHDGTKLAVSFVSINSDEVKSHLAFYNFSGVGQNAVDRLVGGFDHYGNNLIGKIEFLSNNNVIAIAEDRISFYSISQYPELMNEITYDDQIQKVAYSADYVGVIFNNADSLEKYKMLIYNIKGQKISEIKFNEDYRNFEFTKDHILLYNDKLFTLMTMKGKVKYEDYFDMTIQKIIPIDGRQTFMIFNSKYVQQIKLK